MAVNEGIEKGGSIGGKKKSRKACLDQPPGTPYFLAFHLHIFVASSLATRGGLWIKPRAAIFSNNVCVLVRPAKCSPDVRVVHKIILGSSSKRCRFTGGVVIVFLFLGGGGKERTRIMMCFLFFVPHLSNLLSSAWLTVVGVEARYQRHESSLLIYNQRNARYRSR